MSIQTALCPWVQADGTLVYGAGCSIVAVRGNELVAFKADLHKQPVRHLDYIATHGVLISVGDDKQVLLIDAKTFEVKLRCLLKRKASAVLWAQGKSVSLESERLLILDKFGEATEITVAQLRQLGEAGLRQLSQHLAVNPNDKIMHGESTCLS